MYSLTLLLYISTRSPKVIAHNKYSRKLWITDFAIFKCGVKVPTLSSKNLYLKYSNGSYLMLVEREFYWIYYENSEAKNWSVEFTQ